MPKTPTPPLGTFTDLYDLMQHRTDTPPPSSHSPTSVSPDFSTESIDVMKSASPQVAKTAKPQDRLSASLLDRKTAKPQADISMIETRERYSVRLLPQTVKAIKVYAAEHDIKDYEVVEQGLDLLMEKDKTKSPQDR